MATRPSWRYQNADQSHSNGLLDRSSVSSDASSSTLSEINMKTEKCSKGSGSSSSSVKRFVNTFTAKRSSSSSSASSSSAKKNPSNAVVKAKAEPGATNMTALMKKLMHSKRTSSQSSNKTTLVIPADFLAEDLKKNAANAAKIAGLQSTLLHKVSGKSFSHSDSAKKLLKDSKDSRPLSAVLKSESELLNQKEILQSQIAKMRTVISDQNVQIELLTSSESRLKELCSKQEEEIKSLKASLPSAVEEIENTELLVKQETELNQTRQVIPTLQRQVTSLTAQLKYLADGLAEVKADKKEMKAYIEGHVTMPRTPSIHPKLEMSTEFGTSDTSTPLSPDDMILKDMNPCLTPYYDRRNLEEYEDTGNGLSNEEQLAEALQKLACESEKRPNVLQDINSNVSNQSSSCPSKLKQSSRKLGHRIPSLLGVENNPGIMKPYSRTPHQKLCWD